MNTHVDDTRLRGFLVEGIHQLLVIEPEGVFRLRGQGVADGVELPACGRPLGQGAVDFFHPAGLSRGHHVVGQHAGVSRRGVDHFGGFGDLRVAEEFPGIVIKRRTAQHRHVGIAVEVNLPHVVLELDQVDVDVVGVHSRFEVRGRLLQEAEEAFLRVVVAHEVGLHVEDELLPEGFGALVGHSGVGGLGLGHVEHVAVHAVHGQEGGGQAGTGFEELTAVHALLGPVGISQFLDARFNLFLLRILRRRIEFAVGDDLRGNRRVERVFRAFDE